MSRGGGAGGGGQGGRGQGARGRQHTHGRQRAAESDVAGCSHVSRG